MKCLGSILALLVLVAHNRVTSKPWDTTTTRSPTTPPIGETIKQLTNQLIRVNASTSDVVLDTRTPPKVRQQQKVKEQNQEHSHPGIAEPVDEESLNLDEPTKKLSFYKIQKPTTTTSGLSTWILLSGNTPAPITTKTSLNTSSNLVVTDIPSRFKPVFKKRTSSTTKKAVSSTTESTASATTVEVTKLNRVKTSVVNISKKNATTLVPIKQTENRTTILTTTVPHNKLDNNNKTLAVNESLNAIDSNSLPLEAKDNEVDLTTSTPDSKKTRRPTTKRKKNKNKRRRPQLSEKSNNSTKVAHKEKPVGTQLYNYLSREVMPTVGMGLVGLMLTAGLASYFLYPFGAARRNYDIDRKDKEGTYHYVDDYESGGMPEEEAIGKVIAGMQTTTTIAPSYNNYRRYNGKNSYYGNNEIRYRQDGEAAYSSDRDLSYLHQQSSGADSGGYMNDAKRFVVGSVPEEVTPVTVPEHGPRNLKRRKRRHTENNEIMENEIAYSDVTPAYAAEKLSSTEAVVTTTTLPRVNCTTVRSNRTEVAPHKSFVNLMTDLFRMKINFGLQFLQNATQSVSRYLGRVQSRLDHHYRGLNGSYTLYH